MKSIRKSLFAKFIIGIVIAAFCVNSSGIAFATNNLTPPVASQSKDRLPGIEDELKRDGGSKPLFRLSHESVVVRGEKSVGSPVRVETWMEPNSPTRIDVDGTILGHLQQLKDSIKDQARMGVRAEKAVDAFALRVASRLWTIYETAREEGLSKEVTLMIGTWRPDEERPSLKTQISDGLYLLHLELSQMSGRRLVSGVVPLRIAFEISPQTSEIVSGRLSKIEASQQAHKAIYEWFKTTYIDWDIDALWGNRIKVLAVDPDPVKNASIVNNSGVVLNHGILFASGGLDVNSLIKILKKATRTGRVLDVFMDFKSYPLSKRNPSSVREFARWLYEAEKNGEINGDRFNLIIADTEGNLRDWMDARVEGEANRVIAVKDGGNAILDLAHIVHFKEWLGANAILGASAAGVRLGAAVNRMPEYQYINEFFGNDPDKKNKTIQDYLESFYTVFPEFNILNGGAHGAWVTDVQEFMIMVGLYLRMPYWQRVDMANKVFAALTEIFQSKALLEEVLGRPVDRPFATTVGDEGGYAPTDIRGNEEGFKLIVAAIKRAGLENVVQPANDVASSELYDEETGAYELKSEGRILGREAWIAQLKQWYDEYKLIATEDSVAENDPEGGRQLYKIMGNTMIIVGDDRTVTNLDLLKETIEENNEEINCILIKINQNGSISGTLEVIQYALLHGISVAISHRSGETEDDLLAAIAVAANMFLKNPHPKTKKEPVVILKTGSVRRTDRLVKHNYLLKNEAELERYVEKGMGDQRPVQRMALSEERINPKLSPTTIIDMWATEIRDSRGNPTVQVFIKLNNGFIASNAVPSGASTGIRESRELRDGTIVETQPYRITQELVDWIFKGKVKDLATARRILFERESIHDKKGKIKAGKGVSIAVANVNYLIAPRIIAEHIDVAKISSLETLRSDFDQVMFDLEIELAKEDARKIKVNIMGATGNMGPQMVSRLSLDPAKVTVIASARKKDDASYIDNLSKGIIENSVAAAQSKVIIPAVDARGLKAAISDNVQYMQKGAIIFSVAAPMFFEPGKFPVYAPPQGYDSAAQMIKALAPDQEVVVGWQSVPAEWAEDMDFGLSHMQLVLLGKQEACEFIRDNVLSVMCDADVAIINDPDLKMAWALEKLTSIIIASGKELIVEGSLTLAELARFIYEKGPDVTKEEVIEHNRKTLDENLLKRYANNEIFVSHLAEITDRAQSSAHREHRMVGMRRYAEILSVAEQAKKPLIERAINLYKIDVADTKTISAMPGKFNSVVKAAQKLEGPLAVAAIDGEEVLKNPGMLAIAKEMLSKETANVSIVVSANNDDQAGVLKAIGVEDVAKIVQRDISEIVKDLRAQKEKNNIIVGLVADAEKVKVIDTKGIIVYKLRAPAEIKEGVAYTAPWTLIFADFFDRVYKNKKVTERVDALKDNYLNSGKISSADLANLNNLQDVPLVPETDKKIINQINMYRKLVQSI